MRVENIHSRDIPAPAAEVGAVVDSLGSEHDRLWPSRRWPTLRFKRSGPLAIGTPARRRARLTHVIRGRVGTKRLLWWAVVRRCHDAVIEDLLAQADSAAAGRPVPDRPWPLWMRVANGVELRLGGLRGLSRRVGRVWA